MATRNFLVDAPRITPLEVDMALDDADELVLRDFEDAWHDFLESNPSALTGGDKFAHVDSLEAQLEELHLAKENVASELNRQLDFFSQSKSQLESNFKKAMANEAANQQQAFRTWNQRAETVEVANQIFNRTLPWKNFFENLEQAAEANTEPISFPSENSRASNQTQGPGGGAMKPSAKASLLVNRSTQDKLFPSNDLALRAYRIDNALLTSQVKLLQNEIKRQEKTTESLEVAGKFLLEHGIWGLMPKKSASSATTPAAPKFTQPKSESKSTPSVTDSTSRFTAT
eukprot:CAMPEP_0117018320 /NCGR_PEP_ID=MMETSP0472-20121206/14186_1 /TAXON_ID=693140 ORGANISM="Tiarina fusus, Strain LIS" /NCGR_SAMPLE_ID=MMETSP0472 /ASSEMBLY_ACC=CAM_ASM_000603 /LENGTH=285 /DNA_ID=CAMNT_0004722943 /DNA_START=227 /DNA_END=1080 /DNA_ORIENTATION=+